MEKENNNEAKPNITVAGDTVKGGYKLFDFGGDSFTKAIKRTKSSESNLIKNYEERIKSSTGLNTNRTREELRKQQLRK